MQEDDYVLNHFIIACSTFACIFGDPGDLVDPAVWLLHMSWSDSGAIATGF